MRSPVTGSEGLAWEGLVPRRGLEPPRPCERQHLKLVRLPIPPPGHERDELESTAGLVNCAVPGFTGPLALVYALCLYEVEFER